MGSDVGQIFPTASLLRDHSILYALVCEKEISNMGKNHGIPIWCARKKVSKTTFTYVPLSTISPSSMTSIILACIIVDSLWATIIVVLFSQTRARDDWMFLSVFVSNADVAYKSK